MQRKENINLRHLKRSGMITFTTKGSEFEQVLEQCKQQCIKVTVREFPSFVSILLV